LDELKAIAKNGEVFRKYPKDPKFAYAEVVPYLDKLIADIEVSNKGNIKVNGSTVSPYKKEDGDYYVQLQENFSYKVYRLIAETWCLCPSSDSSGWDVHHLVNDGPNVPENLIWIKRGLHNQIRS
jgi:hypothetical protein